MGHSVHEIMTMETMEIGDKVHIGRKRKDRNKKRYFLRGDLESVELLEEGQKFFLYIVRNAALPLAVARTTSKKLNCNKPLRA